MATKLKSFSRQWYCKLLAYLLILASTVSFVSIGFEMLKNEEKLETLTNPTYENGALQYEMGQALGELLYLQYQLISEENIRAGNALDMDEIWQNVRSEIEQRTTYFENHVVIAQGDNPSGSFEFYADAGSVTAPMTAPATQTMTDAQMEEREQELFEIRKQEEIGNQLQNFTRAKLRLEQYSEYFMYLSYNTITKIGLKNAESTQILDSPVYMQYDKLSDDFAWIGSDGKTRYNNVSRYRSSYGGYRGYSDYQSNEQPIRMDDSLLVGVRADYFAACEASWKIDRTLMLQFVMKLGLCLLLAFASFVYLCIVTGRKPASDELHRSWLDRVWFEVHVLAFCGLGLALLGLCALIDIDYLAMLGYRAPFAAVTAVILTLVVLITLSAVRALKGRCFWKSFVCIQLIQRFCRWFCHCMSVLWQGGNLMARGIALAVFVPLLSALWLPAPFLMAGLIYLAYRSVTRFRLITDGAHKIRLGDVDASIDVQGSDLGALADDINSLKAGLAHAVVSEMKSERLKTELISNVSHDIKTPLTSIITYIDLLKQESVENERARGYIEIIDQKSQRLRVLTLDLFEAAKATSGAMNVNYEQVDMQALVRQGLGEFDSQLNSARLDLRISMPEATIYAHADGRLTWRVFENLLSNVVKYALEGSRVYIEVNQVGTRVTLTMKNMSAYALNIPVDELMERFKRGDESRSTEGSGLGLSIAMSLTELQHGEFVIEIDGDLFKVHMTLDAYNPIEGAYKPMQGAADAPLSQAAPRTAVHKRFFKKKP